MKGKDAKTMPKGMPPKGMPPKGKHMMPDGIPMSDKDMDKMMKGGKKGKK